MVGLKERHINDFLKEAKLLLPEICDEINAEQGTFFLQLQIIARQTQRLISENELERLTLVFNLVDQYFQPHNARYTDMTNALSEWWLENLGFKRNSTAWHFLPRKLQLALKQHWQFLGEDYWLRFVPDGVTNP